MEGEYELTYRSADGRLVKGWYWLHEPDMITVRDQAGRTKTTQVGGSAGTEEAIARIMLEDLERDRQN